MKTRNSFTVRRCPSREVWAAELETFSNDPSLLEHIELCADCRQTLDELAAEPELWKEASDTLAMRTADCSHLTQSIWPLSIDDVELSNAHPMSEHEIAQLQSMLPSASHPELLARIGRYELEQLIGRGGMGLVFRAWDTELHRAVAVKTLAMYLMPIGTARERFIREGRAAALLSHPHIVPMYDVITDSPVPALVMQYIAGPTLESWIKQRGALPWQEALRIGAQLADALFAAHSEGLVHRDIKPSNVLLEADGSRALLTDFGLVRAIDDATLTHSGMLAGTPHFMSPEQARGEEVDCRSDLFSLGSLLYFSMTGEPPFRGRESMAVLHGLCNSTQASLCRVNREIPVEVSRFVDQLLNKQVNKRPASSQEVRDELRRLLAAPRRLLGGRNSALAHRPSIRFALAVASCLLLVTGSICGWRAFGPLLHSQPKSNDPNLLATLTDSSGSANSLDAAGVATRQNPAVDPTSLSSSASSALTSELDALAHSAFELEAALDAYVPSVDFEQVQASQLRRPMENLSQQAHALEAELELLHAGHFQPLDSSPGP